MKLNCSNLLKNVCLSIIFFAGWASLCRSQDSGAINVVKTANVPGLTKPIPVSLEGFSGEVADVLRFDLYVQGFSFVALDAAQYQISGSNDGNVVGRLTDKVAQNTLLSRSYSGANLRRQAHTFANDIVFAVTGKKGIGLTQIAFKAQRPDGTGEIYVSDYDGNNPQPVTRDHAIVSKPSWVPGHLALYYNSYKLENPNIFYSDLTTGERKVIAAYGGSNFSPAASPDGSQGRDDFKQGRPAKRVCRQRRWLEFESVDAPESKTRPLAGRRTANGFVSRPRSRAPVACQGAGGRRRNSSIPHIGHRRIRPSRTGRRTANGSRSRARPASSTSAWCPRTAAPTRWCWRGARTRRGRPIRAP